MMQSQQPITIAVAKGRLLNDTLPLLAEVGIQPLDDVDSTRKLIIDTNQSNVKLLLIRATDVPTYVEWGAADFGVTGKDTLLEHGGANLYEPLDLQIARCQLWVAGYPNTDTFQKRLRVASKYVKASQAYFQDRGQQIAMIKLYGSMELAPMVGLADVIVDLVESGNTLKANGLKPLEFICDISARLVVNKASWKMKHADCSRWVDALRKVVG
jgi:ATP phosphoribosyltransferase